MKNVILMIVVLTLVSCNSKTIATEEAPAPFGASDIDYNDIDNKEGPTHVSAPENRPPMADFVDTEQGPWASETEKVEPTAESDESATVGDVPIYVKEGN